MRYNFANGVTIIVQTDDKFSCPSFVRGWWGLTLKLGPLLFGINRFGLNEYDMFD